MNRNIDISIQNLSMPVEKLGLDKRIYRGLQRAGLYTVADIVLAGKLKLRSVRNIGPLSAELIWEAVAHHLGVSEDELTSNPASLEKEYLEAWDAPVTCLQLDQQLIGELESIGMFWIRDLIKARSIAYSKSLWMSVKEIHEIEWALGQYIVQKAQARLQGFSGHFTLTEPLVIPVPNLSLPLPKLSERDWAVVEYRAMQLSTLEQTSTNFDLKDKELRRIFVQAHSQLRQKLVFLSLFLDHFEMKSHTLGKDLENRPLDLQTMVLYLLSEPTLPDLVIEAEKVEKLIALIRSLILQSNPEFIEKMERSWPSFTMLSCLVEPAVAKHEQVRQILQTRTRERKNKLCRKLACLVLTRAGKPMHFSAITKEARQLGHRDFIGTKEMHRMLSKRKELFLRVGPGTYALAEWGAPTPDCYPDIIAAVLQQANRAMPREWIHSQVCAIRPIRPSSLRMILCLHIRFYRSIQNTYGLRGWLPAGEAKTISAPGWLIEAPESYKRIGRAIKKGYPIQKIPAEDRLSC